MTNEIICFEKAASSDLQAIWYLLHADSKMLKEKQILERINDLYILHYQQRILGVLCGTYHAGKVVIDWVVVHPLYPESALREAMIRQFSAVFCREPEIPSRKPDFITQGINNLKALFHNRPYLSELKVL